MPFQLQVLSWAFAARSEVRAAVLSVCLQLVLSVCLQLVCGTAIPFIWPPSQVAQWQTQMPEMVAFRRKVCLVGLHGAVSLLRLGKNQCHHLSQRGHP